MELIKYLSIVENNLEEYEAPSDSVSHEATNFNPYDGPFIFQFAPYWVEHIENGSYFYYDCRYYESGVVTTSFDAFKGGKDGTLEGLLKHISEFDHQQLINPKSKGMLLLREHEKEGDYSVSHWHLAAKDRDGFIILNLSHYPLRPEEVPEDVYEKYQYGIEDIIHEIDYMLVHATFKNH